MMKTPVSVPILGLLVALLIGFSSCSSLNLKNHAEALKNYTYEVQSVRDLKAGGMKIDTNLENANLGSLTGLAWGLLRKDLSLEAVVDLKVTNPTAQTTPLGPFKYLVEIQGKPFFEGSVQEDLRISNGQSKEVPLSFKANLFGVTENEQGAQKLLTDLFTKEGKGKIVLKIKPSFKIAGKNVYYPGYITVDEDLVKSASKLMRN